MFADNESQQCEIKADYPFPSIGSLATNVTWSKSKTVAIVPVADVECKSHRYALLNHQMQWLIFISFFDSETQAGSGIVSIRESRTPFRQTYSLIFLYIGT